MAVCRIKEYAYLKEKVPWIECKRDAWEGDPDGFCLLHSRQEDKDQDDKFTEAVKKKLEAEDYDFLGVFFPGQISFRSYIFDKPADFQLAIFNTDADFSFTTFTQMAEFDGAIFYGNAYFHGATFIKRADFHGDTFTQRAYFDGANFVSEADYFRTTFIQEAIFIFTKFAGSARFVDLNPKREDRSLSPSVFSGIFHGLHIHKDATLLFQKVYLARTEFAGTDLRRVEFDRVTWASRWGRAALYEEILLHRRRWAHIFYVLTLGGLWRKRNHVEKKEEESKKEFKAGKPSYADFAPVERLYRQLKSNYEEERDLKRVGDFHYGEMEMHRLGSPWRQWVPFSWHNLYRVLSGYGERPLRAFIWLLLPIPVWAGLVWGLGINQAGSQDPVSYGNTLFFILEKALLQRPEWPKGITWLGKFLGSLSVLLLPGQAALFILALRNRLGRRR